MVEKTQKEYFYKVKTGFIESQADKPAQDETKIVIINQSI